VSQTQVITSLAYTGKLIQGHKLWQ